MTSDDVFEEHTIDLKIPLERVAVLIGKQGSEKKEIERLTNTKIDVDSKEGDVTIKAKDPLVLLNASEIVKAIARGFNPEIAKLLVKIDYSFDIISLSEFCRTKNEFLRLKGRVIGQEGKARAVIEQLTDSYICVYGKTIGIIGPTESIGIARRAVIMLLEGSQHSSVYSWLEKQKRSLRFGEKEVL